MEQIKQGKNRNMQLIRDDIVNHCDIFCRKCGCSEKPIYLKKIHNLNRQFIASSRQFNKMFIFAKKLKK